MDKKISWESSKTWFLHYYIKTILLTLIIGSLYIWNLHLAPKGWMAWFFIVLYSIGHFGVLSLIAYLPFLLGLRISWSYNSHRVLLPLVMSLMQVGLFIDSVVFSQYRFHINGMVLDLFFNGDGQIIQFNFTMWLWLILVWAPLFLTNLFLSKLVSRKINSGTSGSLISLKKYICSVLVTFIGSQLLHATADIYSYRPITQFAEIYPLSISSRFDWPDSSTKKLLLPEEFSPVLNYPVEPLRCHSPIQKINVLLIVIDALRNDMLNPKVMPNLYRLAQKSLNFTHHFSGSNETRGGLFSLFYGLPPFFFEPMRLQQQSPIVMDQFLASQYQMGIFSSAPLTRPEFDQTIFRKIPNLRLHSLADTPARRDQEILNEWKNFTENISKEKPFFSFLFFDSVHGYDFPESYPQPFQPIWKQINYFELNNNFDPLPFINRYKTSASYVDSLLKQVLATLSKNNLLDNTLIVITSDHGQEFNDNGLNYWGHNSNFTPVQTQVPFIMHWPGKKPREFTHRTTHYDFAPTLLKHIFHCSNASDTFSFGEDLFQKKYHQSILMGYPNQFAIMLENEILLSDQWGRFELLDFHYRPILNKEYNYKLLFQELSKLSRFNK